MALNYKPRSSVIITLLQIFRLKILLHEFKAGQPSWCFQCFPGCSRGFQRSGITAFMRYTHWLPSFCSSTIMHQHIWHWHALSCSQRTSLVDVLTCKFVIFPQQLGFGNLFSFGFGFFCLFVCFYFKCLWDAGTLFFRRFCVARGPHCRICKRKPLFRALCLLALRRTYFLYFCLGAK